jgi:surface antigen
VLEGPPQPGQRDQWQSPETPNTRGTTELTRVTDGGSCRNVREIAIIRGEEVRQESRYCRGQDGRWVLQA